jgi:hypothetical protein
VFYSKHYNNNIIFYGLATKKIAVMIVDYGAAPILGGNSQKSAFCMNGSIEKVHGV